MKAILKSSVVCACCFLSVLFYCLPSGAQTFNFRAFERDSLHTAAYIKNHGLNDTIVVSHDAWDDMVSNSTTWGNNLKFKSIHDFVRFSVDYANDPFKVMEPYTLRLTYKVYGYSNPATPNTASAPISDTLTISYKPDSLSVFQDKQYKKYSGYHKIMIVLTGLYKIDNASGPPVPITLGPSSSFSWLNFNVEGAIIAQPYNKKVKNSNNNTYYDAYNTGALQIAQLADSNNNLAIYWQMAGATLNPNYVLPLNPVNYELEWTFVDDYKVSASGGSSSAIAASGLQYNFSDNATRVVLDTNYYKIPLIYQRGYLVYRVRMVRPDSLSYQYPIYGPWSVGNSGTVNNVSTNYKYYVNPHINDSLNWQYTVSFAEQGKYKHVMSYYDGMLKNRQSITRYNSMPTKLIATEQIYDFEGRPSISLLPTPVNSRNFRYQPNLALNANTASSFRPYRPGDFDTVQLATCPDEILLPPLSSGSLANIYYSPSNPDQAGFQKFVPDAGGYPFVQTIYSPGYDERVEKQGGAGDTLQIGHSHNVKNDYTSTEQTDLNRLFGTNIGWTGYYRKTVSRDPNGQLSLNITDYKGKTMMSAMVGLPDTIRHALVSNDNLSDSVQYTEDFLAGMPQQIAGNQRILDKIFFNEAPGPNTAQYIAAVTPFPTFCPNKYLSVKVDYRYKIFDECGRFVIDTALTHGTLGVTGVVPGGTISYPAPVVPFYMDKGKHSLNKVLTINTDDIALAVDSFISLPTAQNCMKDEPWFIKESVLSKQFPCPEKYIDLNCPSCGSKEYEMMKELYPNMDSSYVERKYGIYRIINGVVVGNGNSDFTVFCGHGTNPSLWTDSFTAGYIDRVMGGGEMSPYPGGLSINNWPTGYTGPGGFVPHGPYIVLNGNDTLHCKYRYQDPCVVTMPDTVVKYGNIYTGLQQIPVQDFINIFNDSIAHALLPMHPEYCKMLDCVDNDAFPRMLGRIPNAKIAEPLSLLTLNDLIHADPIFTVMSAHPTMFPDPEALLGYLPGGFLCLDTLAFNAAYCRSTDNNMLEDCQTAIYHNEIANGILINDFVKEKYFQSIKNLYLANRKRYLYVLKPSFPSGVVNCDICAPVRMTLVPDPIFPDNDSIGVSLLDNFVTSVSNSNASTPTPPSSPGSAYTTALQQYYESLDGVNLDTTMTVDTLGIGPIDIGPLNTIADSAISGYIANANLIVQATLDHMMDDFVNCTPFGNLTAVRAYLQNLYNTGQVTNFTFTPAQVLAALQAGSISIDDLCNPYIISYDGQVPPPSDNTSGIACNNVDYFNDMSQFLTSTALPALLNPGTSNLVYLTGSQFGYDVSTSLYGNPSFCLVRSSYNSAQHVYTVSYSSGTDTLKIMLKAPASLGGQSPFAIGLNETITLKADCYQDVFGNFPAGYIGNSAFALKVVHTPFSGPVVTYKMKGWNSRIAINDLHDNPISQCVPYTQFKAMYEQFQAQADLYQIKGTGHPYFSTMLKNFMNYNLKKVFTEGQYLDFMESSALADSMIIRKEVMYYTSFADSASAFSFINNFNNLDPNVGILPTGIVRYAPNSYEIVYSFKDVPKNKLRIFYNYIKDHPFPNYGITNTTWQAEDEEGHMCFVFMPQGNVTLGSANIFGGSPDSFFVMDYQYSNGQPWAQVWSGTQFETCNSVYFYALDPNNSASNNRSLGQVDQYVRMHTPSSLSRVSIEHCINDEYYTPAKQGYLHYTYSNQDLPPNYVLDSLQTTYLASRIPAFYGKLLSYGHPARPDNIQNLYIGDPSTATNGTKYTTLQYMLGKVGAYFNTLYGNSDNNILFSGANTRNVTVPSGEVLTAYRCKDTAFWYRYFGQGDTLYNVFLRVPGYIDTQYFKTYKLVGYTYNLGEGDSRSFNMTFHSNTAPIHDMVINGFTDFTVAKNKVLHNVLLTHAAHEGFPVPDTVINCERTLLNTAIYEGKIKYKFYIDSIRSKLYGDFYAYIMNNGISEKLLVSYRNQRFNYTLYNYDRAGNLITTIPPAGVVPLSLTNTALVDGTRTAVGNLTPQHRKPSSYKYNTLNQVFDQQTPDGGEVKFFYDAAGHVIFSQNDKQKPDGKMTYTLYDKQGRVEETGQAPIACVYFAPIPNAAPTDTAPYNCYHYDGINHELTPYPEFVTDLLHKTHDQVIAYVRSLDREEVVYTHYDDTCITLAANAGFANQENLRKRVATIKYFDFLAPADTDAVHYTYAMHFSYDIAGNVKTLVRDYPEYHSINQEFKRVDYDYDVISGKVNMLSYNRGFPDQFYQRYTYDADNRVTKAETSTDGIIWQRDAAYQYYQHGPLARMELGDLAVQGVDYAYTIQGWLKAVNGDMLNPAKEMGKDNLDNTPHEVYAADVMALSLDYFKGDYKPIGTDSVVHITALGKNLYNGNIPRATTSIAPFPDLKSQYTYDQLNRIVKADYAYMNRATAILTNTADYYSSYAYDPDGNLRKLVRNGNKPANLLMDSLSYYYGSYTNSSVNDNKLVNITDWAANGSAGNDYAGDITQFTTSNVNRYSYDPTGNVLQDQVSGQDNILWNHYNKVAYDFSGSQGRTLSFNYDGAGNRYLKSVSKVMGVNKDSTLINNDYYVRDAQGNILAIYKDEGGYVMEQQQWVEYFTNQITQWPCSKIYYIGPFIIPFYGSNTYFTGAMYDYALSHNPSWVQHQIADSPVTFYMNSAHNIMANTIYAMAGSPSFYASMGQWAVDHNTTGILTPSLYESITQDGHMESQQSIDALVYLLSPTDISGDEPKSGGVAGLLCAYAPSLMDSMMVNFGVVSENGNCAKKVENLTKDIESSGYKGTDFFNLMYALRTVNTAQYNAFLAQLFDGSSVRFRDGKDATFSFLEGMCNFAPDAMANIFKDMKFDYTGDCAQDVQTLDAWLHEDMSRNATALNDKIFSYSRFCNELFNSVFESEPRIRNTEILPRIYRHFITGMGNEFMTDMAHNFGLDYDENNLDFSTGKLMDMFASGTSGYIPNDLVNYVTQHAQNYGSSVINGYGPPAEVFTMYHFIDSLVRDSVIMGSAYMNTYNTHGSYSFPPLLADATYGIMDGTVSLGLPKTADLNAFINAWSQSRTMLQRVNNTSTLLASVYTADPAKFLVDYINTAGNNNILTHSLMAIPDLNLNRFVDNIYRVKLPPCITITTIDSIVHNVYQQAAHSRRFYLASHVLYGSSRLGTKDYLPGEFYKYYSAADDIADTATLGGWRPWYSLEVNDFIAGLALEPYNALELHSYYASHIIGHKQYELTNHLGNVQGTITDLPYWGTNGGDYAYVTGKSAAMGAAYDYYPFGMLMPDRFVSDTSSKCMTISQSVSVVQMVETTYPAVPWPWAISTVPGGTATVIGGDVEINIPNSTAKVSFDIPVVAGVPGQLVQVILESTPVYGTPVIGVTLSEVVGGTPIQLGYTHFNGGGAFVNPAITPQTNQIKVSFVWNGTPYKVRLKAIWIRSPKPQIQTMLVDVCSKLDDRYRFGFNGQEKVNEWAGIGNHLDFGARAYDSRTGRWYSLDPLATKYPSLSPYAFVANNPIKLVDLDGKKIYILDPTTEGGKVEYIPGTAYIGKDPLVAATWTDLEQAYNSPDKENIIKAVKAEKILTIDPTSDIRSTILNGGIDRVDRKTHSKMKFNPNAPAEIYERKNRRKVAGILRPYRIIAHEVRHFIYHNLLSDKEREAIAPKEEDKKTDLYKNLQDDREQDLDEEYWNISQDNKSSEELNKKGGNEPIRPDHGGRIVKDDSKEPSKKDGDETKK